MPGGNPVSREDANTRDDWSTPETDYLQKKYRVPQDFPADVVWFTQPLASSWWKNTEAGGTGDILPMETATWSLDTSSPVHERQPNPLKVNRGVQAKRWFC
jgi:hypothetical protein